jgi:ABC-2 type transport system permease protein
VLDLSPFTHLALVPAEPWAATSGIVMTGLGVIAATVGLVGFRRRDIVGG